MIHDHFYRMGFFRAFWTRHPWIPLDFTLESMQSSRVDKSSVRSSFRASFLNFVAATSTLKLSKSILCHIKSLSIVTETAELCASIDLHL